VSAASDQAIVPLRIEHRILTVRGVKVIIDADLAELYGVPTKRLNEQVKRNPGRFPADFMFQLNAIEKAEVVANCDHLARLKFAKALPFAFTEFGAIQAANVLNSPQAVEMGVYVVRAFVQLRELMVGHRDLSKRLDALEHKTEALALSHDTFSRNTRAQLKQVFDALRELMTPPDPPKRPIGFVIEDKANSKLGKKAESKRKNIAAGRGKKK
jgi:ORF6N domain